MEVILTDSTPRTGEPATWGSGQRWLDCSWATWAPYNGRHGLLFNEKISRPLETKLEQIAAKAVKQRPKSVVREIRTPRSVGTGGGRPPPVTRWAPSNGRPYRDRETGNGFEASSEFGADRLSAWRYHPNSRRPRQNQ